MSSSTPSFDIFWRGQLLIALVCFLLANAANAQTGTLTGSVPKVAPFVGGIARAYSLETGESYGTSIAANGKFKLTLPAGSYAVVSEMLAKLKRSQKIDIVRIKPKKNATFLTKTTARPVEVASGIRVSVGNFHAVTPEGAPIKLSDGKPILWDGLLINDILNNNNPCKIRVVEDRKYGRYDAVLNEVKLQASRYAAKRINAKKALSVLKANAPQYRVTGSFQMNANEEMLGSASVQIIDLRNDRTVWSGEFSGLTDIDKFSETISKSTAEALCVPQRVTGTFDGVQHAVGSGYAVDYSWTGSATFKIASMLPSDPNKPTNLDIALYQLETSNIDSFNVAGTVGNCTKSGSVGSTPPQPPSTGAMMVWLDPNTELGYRYVIALGLAHEDAYQEVVQCPDGTTSSPEAATAELQIAESEADYPYTQDPYSYKGTHTVGDTTMHWNFTAGL